MFTWKTASYSPLKFDNWTLDDKKNAQNFHPNKGALTKCCVNTLYRHMHPQTSRQPQSAVTLWGQSTDNGPTPSQQCFLWPNKIIKRLSDCFPLFQCLFELGWRWMQPRRRQTWQCEQQQSGARHHFTPVLQFTVQSASLKENILEWWEGLPIRVPNTKGWFGALSCLTGLATKWRWMACVGRSRQGARYIVSTCQSSCRNKSETNAIAEWRDKNRKRGKKREGDVFKTSLNRCTFTVTQRHKWSPLKRRAVFYQRTGQRNQQFCDSSFEGFLLFGVECWGVCGALAAEAIWVSSTSKVGQLVPVPLLMCWRGALCGGLRARLKGLRS